MNKNLRNIGIATLVAGALVYPAMKLYQYIAKRMAEGEEEAETPRKTMHLLHRNKHTPHHTARHNGHAKHGIA